MSSASCFSTLWSLFNNQFTWYESTFTYSCRGGALAESINIITLVQLLLKISKGVIRLKTFRLYSRISDLRDQPSHVLVSVSNFKSFQWILDPKSEPDTKHKAKSSLSSSWAQARIAAISRQQALSGDSIDCDQSLIRKFAAPSYIR